MAFNPFAWFKSAIAAGAERGAERAVYEWMMRCLPPCPPPERPGRVMLAGNAFHAVNNIEEYMALTQNITDLRIRGSAAGYVSAGPVVILNERGNPMDPQPAPETLQVAHLNLQDFYVAADGRVVIIGDDAMSPNAEWSARISALETGAEDDLTLSGFYDEDAVGSVDGGALGAFTAVAAADLPPRAVAPAPVEPPVEPPADPA